MPSYSVGMDYPLTRESAAALFVHESVDSTNSVLAALAADSDELTTVLTLDQTAGRGRMGRDWVSPAGKTIAVSTLIRPRSLDYVGWVPLVAGLAMTRAIRVVLGAEHAGRVGLKWPNDVLIAEKKVCGILAELQPDASVVVGAGVNLTLGEEELPVPTATSLTLAGASGTAIELADALTARYLAELGVLIEEFRAFGPERTRATVSIDCASVGRAVTVSLPDGSTLAGTATSLDADGRLVLATGRGEVAVAAGDVTHLRYE